MSEQETPTAVLEETTEPTPAARCYAFKREYDQ